MFSEIVKWILVVLYTIGILGTIGDVGKPRNALTPGDAARATFVGGLLIASILYFWK
jgi:hypothetical protein